MHKQVTAPSLLYVAVLCVVVFPEQLIVDINSSQRVNIDA
jgi:hypothetical protein